MDLCAAHFRFYAELNDFLPASRGRVDREYRFDGHPSVKDAIEAQGVPHTEVELILANGAAVGFEYQIQPGDRLSVYPVFESLDVSPIVRLRDAPLREIRFVLDGHVGKLARMLRLLGFDALYRRDYDDDEIVLESIENRRVILTKDRGILKRKAVTHGYCVRSAIPEEQAREVLNRFDLRLRIAPFSRCMECNGELERVEKAAILDKLEPLTQQYYEEFWRCAGCGRIFWRGSHYARLKGLVEGLMRR